MKNKLIQISAWIAAHITLVVVLVTAVALFLPSSFNWIDTQKQAFNYLKVLDSGHYNHEKLEEIIRFVQRDLCCRKSDRKSVV